MKFFALVATLVEAILPFLLNQSNMFRSVFLSLLFLIPSLSLAQNFTRADTLRGSITPERAWWDVVFYDLYVIPNPNDSTLRGVNTITYKVLKPGFVMQIDLQEPLEIDRILQDGKSLPFTRDGNVFFVGLESIQMPGMTKEIRIEYSGMPVVARRAPWEGGLVWARDSQKRPWIATACQGIGASVWWPLKDHQADEPDSMRISLRVPEGLIGVSNGRLRDRRPQSDGTEIFEWFVANPINSYGVTMNVAHYAQFGDTYGGEVGELDLDYWVLDYNLEKAKAHFDVVKPMMEAFEHWFGPYPFYEDSFKLIETPFVGMEHQSGVAYGNRYLFGYTGRDLSGSGWGMKWDFMIIHESGHEWFGNSITTADIADMWVHEGFTHYSETLFTEYTYGKEGGDAYLQGIRRNIQNDKPIIGQYGLNNKGSGDMYYKGAAMIHTIRQVMDDDERFRGMLRDLNKTYFKKITTSKQVEAFISEYAGVDLSAVFDQYLRTTNVPILEYRWTNQGLEARWNNTVPMFDLPVKVSTGADWIRIRPGADWKAYPELGTQKAVLTADPNVYIEVKAIE
jgi:aminopeptidase N